MGFEPARPALPGDLDAVVSCLEAGFSLRLADAHKAAVRSMLDEGTSLVVTDGPLVVGALVSHRVELTLPGLEQIAARCVSDLAVRPTHRRRGALRALMVTALGEARRRGDAIAVLGASEAAIYGRFGWGAATASATYVIDRLATSPLAASRGAGGTVELLDEDAAASVLPQVLDAARRRRAGEISRHPALWAQLLGASETERAARFVAAYLEDDQVDGYAIYEVRGDGPDRRAVQLVECATVSDAAYTGLFAYLVGIDLADSLRTGERPVDEPVRHLLDDPRALRTVGHCDGAWLRIVDVREALERRGFAAPGRVVLELRDDLCPWNAGCWAVEVDETGQGAVAPSRGEGELALGASELAALFLGGTRATSLRVAGRVEERAPGAARRLDALLCCDPVPYCTAI